MFQTLVLCIALLLATGPARSGELSDDGDKLLEGMSIVGNDEAPKSLVIVPWKSSGLGDSLDVSTVFGEGRDPVDRDVFMRELSYYEIRAESRRPLGSSSP
jgi:hypothetical protein